MNRIYDYDLPMTMKDLSPHNPEAHAAVQDYHRIEKLYAMATRQLESYKPGEFASIAARMSGPDVKIKNRPHLLAFCIQCFAVEFVEDLLALGVNPRKEQVFADMLGADEDAQEYYQSILRRI